jgi:hypothetical protein
MPRIHTARKRSTFDPGTASAGTAPRYPLFRAEPVAATKQVLRFLTAYTMLLLPLHVGISYLSTHSLALAVPVVLVTAAALLAVALARWLALDDLLQKVPLLLVLALVGAGFVFLTSQPFPRGFAGWDFIGGLFILMVVVSLLGTLYRPMAATYQAVTTKTPFRDLCVVAGAMLASLALVLAAHALPRFVLGMVACTVCGGYAGLVLTEFAAWARVNPAVSLERVMAFEGGSERRQKTDPIGAMLGAGVFGLGFGLSCAVCDNARTPAPDFARVVLAISGGLEQAKAVLEVMLLFGLIGMGLGFLKAGYSLGATRPGNPLLALRFTWQALVVFLTYPETTHPLVHRFRVKWVRPPAVRASLTCAALITVATALFAPEAKPREEPKEQPSSPPPAPFLSRPAAPREIPPGDLEFARISGQPPELWLGPEYAPSRPPAPAAAPASAVVPKTHEAGSRSFLDRLVGLVVAPPLCLALIVFLVGLHVLPTYGGFFEKRESPASPR